MRLGQRNLPGKPERGRTEGPPVPAGLLRGNDGRLLDTQPPPREMPPEAVQTEREEALAHRYNQRCDGEETIAEFFQRVRPKVAA